MPLPEPWTLAAPPTTLESGQAWVHHVQRPSDEKTYALKILKNPRRAGRFAREVSAMQTLRQRGVAAIPEVVEAVLDGERPFFVMPWFEEGSLDDYIQNRRAGFDSTAADLDVILQVAEALAEIHGAGYAHRDLKPSNVLLAPNGIALADFGLCLHIEDVQERLTARSEPIGSWLYTAPENEGGLNDEVDQRPGDFYAFGKLLWAVLAGRRPPARENHLEGPNRLSQVLSDPRYQRLEPLLEQLANTDPRARLADWDAVGQELELMKRSLEPGSVFPPEATSRDALERAKRVRDLPQVADVLRDRQRETRQREWIGGVFTQMAQAAREEIDAQLTELSQATDGAYQFTFSSGGEALQTLFRLGSLEIPSFDPAAPSGVGEGSPLLFHGYSPIGAELPCINLPVLSSLQASDVLWLVRVPSLMSFPGPAEYSFPEPLVNAFFNHRGPLRLYLSGSQEIAVDFAVNSARAFVQFAEAYLEILDVGADYRSPEAWSNALGSTGDF